MRLRNAVWVLALLIGAAAAGTGRAQDVTEEQRRELERIATLGYVTGSERAPVVAGVTVHDPDAYDGYTIYVSRGYPGAFLIDMDGRILHVWQEKGSKEWARAWAYPNGDVLAISDSPARLAKFDRDSNLVWTYGGPDLAAHHDFQVQPDGRVYVLMRRARFLDWLSESPLLEDMVCILEPDGEAVRVTDCVSIPEAFRDSEYAYMLSAEWFMEGGDPFHTNSVEVLDGRVPHPAFRSGNVLLSIRNMDCLAVLDPREREIVWVSRGRWQRQHEARVTPSGYVLLFDNREFDGQSRVVKYDAAEDDVVWSYTSEGFYSAGAGAQQLLPNGNLLITESQEGRLFEVALDGRLVWEYLNPRRIGGQEPIVVLFARGYRAPYDYFTGDFAEYLAARRAAE
jgi:hypothetical protein